MLADLQQVSDFVQYLGNLRILHPASTIGGIRVNARAVVQLKYQLTNWYIVEFTSQGHSVKLSRATNVPVGEGTPRSDANRPLRVTPDRRFGWRP